jgi:hypothetical protein
MLTSQFVAKFLRARGVDRVFGTPGSDTIDLIQAFAREGVEYVLTHHENTAAYMAAAYGELTGVPGVVVVTKGPASPISPRASPPPISTGGRSSSSRRSSAPIFSRRTRIRTCP